MAAHSLPVNERARVGVPEDPVTGSAHTKLTPYWSARLGRPVLSARQLSKRRGSLRCRMAGDRVEIAGMAVPYLQGTISIQARHRATWRSCNLATCAA